MWKALRIVPYTWQGLGQYDPFIEMVVVMVVIAVEVESYRLI